MNQRRAFSLIELLVVIAIIGILAAIAFPVFARSKDSAYRSGDMSNMNELRTALQLYRADQGGFPPALLGYVGPYENVSAGNIVPANSVRSALFPRRVSSLSTFRPAYNRVSEGAANVPFNASNIESGLVDFVTPAVWPAIDTTQTAIYGAGAAGDPRQRFAYPNDNRFVNRAVGVVNSAGCVTQNNFYYRISGYDAANVKDDKGERTELRYSLFWSGWTVPNDPCSPLPATEMGNANDSPRQLGYSDPPDTTVITWNTFFRDFGGAAPGHVKRDIVLFLGGGARPFDSRTVADNAWQTQPVP